MRHRILVSSILCLSSIWGACGSDEASLASTGSDWEYTDTSSPGADASSDAAVSPDGQTPADGEQPELTGNTNIAFGGVQDFGFFRRQLDQNVVPEIGTFDASGFFAEHHTPLPTPDCGERVCLQPMLGVLSNLFNGNTCTMLQVGLNSPMVANPDSRPPLSLTVVVDVSGSMEDAGKLNFLRQGLDQMLDELRDGDTMALVTYSSDAHVALEMTPLATQRRELRDAVAALRAEGGTNLYAGLEMGYLVAQAAYDSGRQNRVLLISDGIPSAGITSTDAILGMSAAYNQDGLGLTTIGLGTDFNYDLMSELAQSGDGNFYFVEDAGAVEEVFADEVSYFTVPVAYDLTLGVTSGVDFTVSAVHGTTRWERTSEGGQLTIPSVFLAHRRSHDDVTEEGGRRGGGSALMLELMPRRLTGEEEPSVVGDVSLTYREPGTDRIVEQSARVMYPYAPWVLQTTGFFDAPGNQTAIVQKSFVMLNLYIGMELAITAFHNRRDASEEIAGLRNLLDAVRDYNEELEDVDIDFDIELVEQLIRVLVANGAVPPPPAPPAEDPWPAD